MLATEHSQNIKADHAQKARDCLQASDIEFENGDVVRGAQKLWAATANAVMGIAQERGWQCNTRESLKLAAIRVARERDEPMLEAGYAVAEKFSRHFHEDSMEHWERDADIPLVKEFVDRLLAD